jgi:hypothetical protein
LLLAGCSVFQNNQWQAGKRLIAFNTMRAAVRGLYVSAHKFTCRLGNINTGNTGQMTGSLETPDKKPLQ